MQFGIKTALNKCLADSNLCAIKIKVRLDNDNFSGTIGFMDNEDCAEAYLAINKGDLESTFGDDNDIIESIKEEFFAGYSGLRHVWNCFYPESEVVIAELSELEASAKNDGEVY